MKSFIKDQIANITIIITFMMFILFSYVFNYTPGTKIFEDNFLQFIEEMMMFLPLMFLLIGLFDVWAPKEKIERHIGSDSGIKGAVWMILLAMLQAGPLYGAFPVSYVLYKKGASIRNIFIYLGAFSTLKIPMLSFEIGFLGLKFSLLRTILTIPVFIIIAIIMDNYLKTRNFQIKGE
ncbi:MAG TPA: permease [Spirochaetota bacterium]|nr:permease [Spirochaetota bacterium]HPC42346.1 permease [Spirochaetota bacterium]HPL17840.1 permease [Spirochaetota bacterium]HQF10205.1 permease [Spirochaetota bacterium]HQH99351.1 permease [Spirochaetota bacterium]